MPMVVLDTGPLGMLSLRPGVPDGDACKEWLDHLLDEGVRVILPEIADYELRRELLRLRLAGSIARLDRLRAALEFLPITTEAMLQAAAFWAEIRREGHPTSDPKALDGDVILAAQAATLHVTDVILAAQAATLHVTDVILATTNVGHLSRLIPAQEWQRIR